MTVTFGPGVVLGPGVQVIFGATPPTPLTALPTLVAVEEAQVPDLTVATVDQAW